MSVCRLRRHGREIQARGLRTACMRKTSCAFLFRGIMAHLQRMKFYIYVISRLRGSISCSTRRHSQVVRQGSAKPSFPGSNPGVASRQKPRNCNGYGVFLLLFLGRLPLHLPLSDFYTPFQPLETLLINASIRDALSCFIWSVTWPYTSRVKAAVAWPRFPWTVLISSPERIAATA